MQKLVIDESRCKGCALCTTVCPQGLVQLDERINRLGYRPARIAEGDQERCVSCALCAKICPDLAMSVWRPKKED